jgi:cardiolipin synthase
MPSPPPAGSLVPVEPRPGVDDLGETLLDATVPRPHFTGGNQIALLRGGDQLFPAMRAAIDAAVDSVWLATYIFHDDDTALAMCDTLEAAAARGVRVCVVIDGFGSNRSVDVVEARLTQGGVEVAVFRPLRSVLAWFQPGQLRRLHQKLCVVDARVGFVGGINVIDDRLDMRHGRSEQPRLDFAARAEGEVVQAMAQAARAMWTRAHLGREWREEVKALMRVSNRITRIPAQVRLLADRLRLSWPGRGATPADALAPMRAAFVVRDNLRQRRTIERSYVEAIRAARERVLLISPYFYPGLRFRRALRDAARRGVAVHLVMQGKPDYRIAALAARVVYDELMRHGVHIHEYMPAYLHAKVAVVDHAWATVGSSNIDPMSLLLNLEANLVVRDERFTTQLAGEIEAAIAASREIRRDDVITHGWLGLARRALVAWCAYVYLRIAGVSGRY